MSVAKRVWSSLEWKFSVSVTGAALSGFVLFHMLGNLQLFLGQDAMNAYAALLKGMPGPLWAARLGLLAALGVHLWGNAVLWRRNKAARPVAYAGLKPIKSTLQSRTMLLSGVVILAFTLYHLAHFTLGLTHPGHFALIDSAGRHDVYSMVALGFREPFVAAPYLAAMGLLFMHLSHGVASVFQTAGLRRPGWRRAIDGFGTLFAAAVVLGNVALVLACFFGVIQPAQGIG